MRGGLVGGVCFLAFLLSSGIKGQNLLNSYDPQQGGNSRHTESKSADAKNEDEEKSGVNSQYDLADADAPAEASDLAFRQYEPDSSEAQAKADDASNSVEIKSENQIISTSLNEPESGLRFGASSANAFAGSTSRVISQNDYIVPHLMLGGENLIVCSRESELHNVWSPMYQCLVCVCVREGWALQAVCVSCNTCLNPPQPGPPIVIIETPPTVDILIPPPLPPIQPPRPPLPPLPPPLPPPPPPLPLPIPTPPPILPPPQPESQVSCDPLPTDLPFENPLNPCQICICTRIYDLLGQTDIQIQCQENPQCDTSPDIIPIPPIPVPPQPVPLPLCERFPPNVLFPHPLDSCQICKCVVEVDYYIPEQRILCIPNPGCDIIEEPLLIIPDKPVPIPEIPEEVYPIIIPPPIPEPEPEPEPMPWPPMVLPSSPPSPLPGPPPHETCRPYPPNTPFQHPWDECQICMCSEIYGKNVVNIEVNCYTKKSCCIEPPIPEPVVSPLPLPMYPTVNIIFIEPQCRYQSPQSPFVADCNVCVCQVIYTYVVAQCSPQPNCGASPYPLIGGIADASAQAVANAYSQDYSLQNQPGFYGISDTQSLASQYPYNIGISDVPLGSPYPNFYNNIYGNLPSELAQSEATAISQSGNLSPYPNSYFYSPEVSQSSAMAQAHAQSLSGQPSYLINGYPFTGNSLSSAQAQAEAIANTQYENTVPYSQYPYSLAGGSLSSAQAEAEAFANSQYSGLNTPYNAYPYSFGDGSLTNVQNIIPSGQYSGLSQYMNYPYSLGQSSANAQAEALANAQSGVPFYGPTQNYLGNNGLLSQQLLNDANAQYGTYGGYPYSPGGTNYYDVQAQAEALANAQSGGVPQYNINPYYSEGSQSNSLAQAMAASDLYPNMYPQSSNVNPLYQPETTAQSLAQASAISGRPLIRSGPGLCKYNGDKYHHNCQACYCFREVTGSLYTLCLGNPCA